MKIVKVNIGEEKEYVQLLEEIVFSESEILFGVVFLEIILFDNYEREDI